MSIHTDQLEELLAITAQRDRLLAALIAVVAVADRKTDVFDEARTAIEAATLQVKP